MDKVNDMHYGSNSFTFQKAVELRNRMTKAETVLWEELRHGKFMGLKFRRQHPIDRFIVDFYCHKHKLVIELDGSIHNLPEVAENDKIREEELKDFGLEVLRFTNSIVLQNIQEVLNTMEKFISSTEKNSAALFHPLGRGKEKSSRILGYSTPLEKEKELKAENQRKSRPQYSLIEPVETKLFKVYPNPAHDYITLKYKCDNNKLEYIIQDASGKVLIQQVLNTANNEQLINISDLSAGIYSFILYGDGNLIEVKKITVVK